MNGTKRPIIHFHSIYIRSTIKEYSQDLSAWRRGWYYYIEKRVRVQTKHFESYKDILVDFLIARRGSYQRPFMHFSLIFLFAIGVTSAPILAETYPGAIPKSLEEYTPASAVVSSLDMTEYGVQTQISEKPRDQIVDYTIVKGDTLSTVAQKFAVSVDSIKWANDIRGDSLTVGQKLKIPPVTGVVHKVKEGDTVYSIAKKYKTDAQKIVNFPFNDFSDLDTFALTAGQTLVVPDGVPPQAIAPVMSRPIIPIPGVAGTGQFQWPTNGIITQYPVWYHMALDIANSGAPGIAAADGGTVILVQYLRYDYGFHIIVDHGNGYSTLYAHLSEIYVKPGDRVSRGQVVGRMGSTGRSTGTHLHFEIRRNGVSTNPLPFLK